MLAFLEHIFNKQMLGFNQVTKRAAKTNLPKFTCELSKKANKHLKRKKKLIKQTKVYA